MSNTETEFDDTASETKPRKARKRNTERKANFYLIEGKNSKELGQFPESVIGTPLERKIPPFAQDMFGRMVNGITKIKTDIRKPNGAFDKTFDFTITSEPERAERERENIIEIEPEDYDETQDFSFDAKDGQMNATEVENLLLKERLKRNEEDVTRQRSGNQSEMQTLISALEDSRREQRELLMLLVTQSQKPQQDSSTQALNMMEKAFGIVNRAKTISDEFSPNETGGGSSTMIGDAAKLVESLGRHAGSILPVLGGLLGGGMSKTQARPARTQNAPATNGGGQSSGLADLAIKVQKKEVNQK